jgi:class 3 adenylate cyclase/tetratricopeptide (TPR) repeat protein
VANPIACPSCGSANEAGRKFCGECGAALARACPSCGTPNPPDVKFCGECGTALAQEGATAAAPAGGGSAGAATTTPPAAERRLVSVLFADLVGFTTLSESRDAEEVRELLSRYFETSRRLIELYGGTVEKFIGDAVMAVWGTPVATEDDAERAVRAALDLVAAVSALGDEVGAPELRARAGVLTGEAAVTIGAEGQGMVAGDLVNTASRIQSAAEPGTVFVGEATRRSTEQTIMYEDAGAFELKGKEGLTPLWTAQRVISGLRGALRSQGLEAPFVGRDRELRLVKELFHACADEQKAHLVSVTGVAGIGKSRLAWEFYKYFDGIADTVYWHRGRCLSYGEGVTYWALADMVRMRCRIAEDEDLESARAKLRATLDEHILDAEERGFLEPRLAHLLGLAEHQARDQQDLFAAWRLFFERLSETYPVLLAFEDMQWADASLLDFVETLLDWSRNHPIFVVTLARPELLDRRPTWGAGQRSFTSLYLEPLSAHAMEALLTGLVPGLPGDVRDRILVRAEGIPLYAVETVRMLLDRGLLVPEGSAYVLAGAVEALDVPETLHALIAARLDGLSADERQLLQDAAVLGKTFTKDALAALAGAQVDIDPLLNGLVGKEVLGVQTDPRSPEHGQYGFLQDLVRHVAYEMLSKRERRARHLAAAAHLQSAFAFDEDEVIEVIASHYVAALDAVPDADDASVVRAKAQAALARAGERAESLAAAAEARRYFERAARLTEDAPEKARLLARAGEMAARAADPDAARGLLEEAIELYEATGDTHAAARVSTTVARLDRFTGRLEEGLARLERAFDVISADEPDEDLALLAARLSLSYWTAGDLERAAERAELALDIAETHGFTEAICIALGAKAAVAHSRGHAQESEGLLKQELEIALEHDLPEEASSAYFILSDQSFHRDRYSDALSYLDESRALAHRLGDRPYEWSVLAETTYALFMLGRWDDALAVMEELTEEQTRSGGMFLSFLSGPLEIHLHRGEAAAAQHVYSIFASLEGSSDVQERACYYGATAAMHRSEGRLREALEAGRKVLDGRDTLGISHQAVEQGLVEALDAAVAIEDRLAVQELLQTIESVPPGRRPPFLAAHAHRFRGRLDDVAGELDAAARRFREIGIPFWLGVTLLERAELTGDEDAFAEAREIFESLKAAPWLARTEAAATRRAEVPA